MRAYYNQIQVLYCESQKNSSGKSGDIIGSNGTFWKTLYLRQSMKKRKCNSRNSPLMQLWYLLPFFSSTPVEFNSPKKWTTAFQICYISIPWTLQWNLYRPWFLRIFNPTDGLNINLSQCTKLKMPLMSHSDIWNSK